MHPGHAVRPRRLPVQRCRPGRAGPCRAGAAKPGCLRHRAPGRHRPGATTGHRGRRPGHRHHLRGPRRTGPATLRCHHQRGPLRGPTDRANPGRQPSRRTEGRAGRGPTRPGPAGADHCRSRRHRPAPLPGQRGPRGGRSAAPHRQQRAGHPSGGGHLIRAAGGTAGSPDVDAGAGPPTSTRWAAEAGRPTHHQAHQPHQHTHTSPATP